MGKSLDKQAMAHGSEVAKPILRSMVTMSRGDFARELAKAFMVGASAGLRKAADLCDYEISLYPTLRNEASKRQAEDIKVCCLATAGRLDRGEYENPTSQVMS
jgi:hypothetical protein